jgi:hypothetical protein
MTLATGCGKRPDPPSSAKNTAATPPDSTAKSAKRTAEKVALQIVEAKIDPVPTGPAPGEKLPVELPTIDPEAPPAPADSLTAALRA